MVLFFVDGCTGLGVVGSLGVVHAIRGWTCLSVMGRVGARRLWLCVGSNIQVLQKVDKELLLVLLLMLLELLLVLYVIKSFRTLVDAILSHGCVHGRDYFRHLGDHSREGRDFSCYCL